MSRKLLVTGGCGFIGSHFIRGFLSHHPEWDILNLDLLTYAGNPANTADFSRNKRYTFVQGDIGDNSLVSRLIKDAAAVINFAAETHVDRSIDDPNTFLTTNILGLRNLLDAARQHKIERFLHISTDEVYGSLEKGYAAETAPLEPNSPYSAAKAAADLLARSYWKTYSFPVMIARSCNNYGPYQFPEKVIPLFITNLIQNKKVPLYGDGLNRREWIYVEDNCAALEMVLLKGKPGGIYNIGSSDEKSNLELTHAILDAMGQGADRIQYVKDRPGHDFRYAMAADKIKQLGFKPAWTFSRGLTETVRWYQAHLDWWQPLKKDKFTLK